MRGAVVFSRALLVACLLSGALISAARAHHSFAQFQMDRNLELKGVVKSWEWTNPHSWLTLLAPNAAGDVVEWRLEGASINELARAGWSRKLLKEGDAVTVQYHPLRSGEQGGAFFSVTTADGSTYGERVR